MADTQDAQDQIQDQTPQDDKTRTQEQFEKLTESNKALQEERDKERQEKEALQREHKNLLETIKPIIPTPQPPSASQYSNLSQEQVNDVFKNMVDTDGYLDGNKLIQVLAEMNSRAVKAEQKAEVAQQSIQKMEKTQRDFEESAKMKKVHEKYPELDPHNEAFDELFFDRVSNEMLGQIARKGVDDPMAAADVIAGFMGKTVKEKQEQLEKENQKIAINAVRPRSSMSKGYYEQDDQDELIRQVRLGKKGAVGEALKRLEQQK